MSSFSFEYVEIIEAAIMGAARMFAVFMVLPAISNQALDNTVIRLGLAVTLSLPMLQGNYEALLQNHNDSTGMLFLYLIKESILGLFLGLLAAIPFWCLQGVGDLIDNQRGASNADQMDVTLGTTASPLAGLLNKYFSALYFTFGGFLLFLAVIYKSYSIWPLQSILPELTISTTIKVLALLDYLMRWIILFAAPLAMAMFFVEFGLALINRFAQQLNVFVLAMPLKSITAMFVLYLYLPIIAPYLIKEINNQTFMLDKLQVLLK